jgi:hypothetical protein
VSVLVLFLIAVLVPLEGDAFMRGGYGPVWNGNILGGGWVCFQSQITGCSQGFNAACDGVRDDKTAWNNFLNYASGVPMAKLYIPPGANCVNSGGGGFKTTIPGASMHVDGTKVPGLIIWAYGASFDTLFIGAPGALFPDNTHNALLLNANAGDGAVSLKNARDVSIFAVNKWIIVSGLATQRFGYPQNWQVFEYHKITAINGAVLTLDHPLSYSYKSTWPQAPTGDANNPDMGGPASAYLMNDAWDQDVTIYGLRVKQTTNAIFDAARAVSIVGMLFDIGDGIAPSMSMNYTVTNINVGNPEFDKLVDTLTIDHVTARQFIFQSSSFNNVSISNATMTVLNGTTKNMTMTNVTISDARMGSLAYGHGTLFSIAGSTVTAARGVNICMPSVASGSSGMTFSGGTFTASKSGIVDKDNLFRWAIPGQAYYFAASDGTDNSSPHTKFSITDFREDASNYYVDTDIIGSLPAPTCGGVTCACYTTYQASAVSQTNTGPADLTRFAAP